MFFLGFSIYKTKSSTHIVSLTFFLVWMLCFLFPFFFLSFSPLISLAISSNTVLNTSSESRHTGLAYELREKHPFTIKYYSYMPFTRLRRLPFPILKEKKILFIMNSFCGLSVCVYWDDNMFFVLYWYGV